jgi:hypothetical protein
MQMMVNYRTYKHALSLKDLLNLALNNISLFSKRHYTTTAKKNDQVAEKVDIFSLFQNLLAPDDSSLMKQAVVTTFPRQNYNICSSIWYRALFWHYIIEFWRAFFNHMFYGRRGKVWSGSRQSFHNYQIRVCVLKFVF